jgi:hypothetical protein
MYVLISPSPPFDTYTYVAASAAPKVFMRVDTRLSSVRLAVAGFALREVSGGPKAVVNRKGEEIVRRRLGVHVFSIAVNYVVGERGNPRVSRC